MNTMCVTLKDIAEKARADERRAKVASASESAGAAVHDTAVQGAKVVAGGLGLAKVGVAGFFRGLRKGSVAA